MPRGGKRPGAGTKPGRRWQSTMEKALAREETRKYIQQHIPAMLRAQIANAIGIGHLYTRDKKGKFARIEDEAQIDKLLSEGEEGKTYWIFAKDPSTQAFSDLMNRAIDKPAEQVKVTGGDDGPVEHVFRWQS
jgi:hypothetical protein